MVTKGERLRPPGATADAVVPHRPLHPGCKPIGLLWPDGDWVSLPRGQRVEDHSPRRLLNTSHAGGEPPLPAHRAKNDSISEHAMARPLALCASHKSGHTLSIGIARILTSGGFVSEVHTSSRFDERSHDSVHLRQRGVQDRRREGSTRRVQEVAKRARPAHLGLGAPERPREREVALAIAQGLKSARRYPVLPSR